MRVRITLYTGGMLNFSVHPSVISPHGTLNRFVDAVVKPIRDLSRIEVISFDEELECDVSELTHDALIEPWCGKGERVALFHEFIVGMPEEGSRGYIEREADFVERYKLRKQVQHKQIHAIEVDSLIDVRSVRMVKQERKHRLMMERYHSDPLFKKLINERRRVQALNQRKRAKEGVAN